MEWITQGLPQILIGSSFRYFLLAGIPFLIFYVFFKKRFQKNKIQKRIENRKRFFNEIKHSFSTLAVITVLGTMVFFTSFRDHTKIYTDIQEYSLWWIPLSIVLSLIIHDAYFYWMHRLVHGKTLYRSVHRTHHLSVNPSPWTSYSFHILEAILEHLILFILVFSIPMHPLAVVLFGLTSFIFNVYGHLGYEIAPRWFRNSFLFEIMSSSVYHNLHHKKFHGNYGLYFRWWDRWMGTENPEYVKLYDEIQARRFGKNAFKQPSYSSASILLLIVALLCFSFAMPKNQAPDISGIWWAQGENGDGMVEITQDKDGKINGKLIKALDEKHQEKIDQVLTQKSMEEIIILSDFEFSGDSIWQNGQLLSLKRKKKMEGSLKLLPSGKLEVTGKWRRFQKTFIWKKKEN